MTAPHVLRRPRIWIALGVLLAVLVGLRVALPELLRRLIESNASTTLGRRVEVADVDLGLVLGRVLVEGLAVGGPDLAAPVAAESAVLRCASVGVRIAWLPLVQGKIQLREIALREPLLRLDRTPDGAIAPIVLAPPAPEPAEEIAEAAGAEAGGGLDLAIDKLVLEAAELRFVRQRDAASIALLRFESLSLGDLSMREDVFGIGAVELRGPELQVNSERLSDGAAAGAASANASTTPPLEPTPAAQPAAAPAKHRVKDLHIEGARFTWRLPNGEAVELELEIRAQNLGVGGEAFPLDIRLTTDGASLALQGRLAIEPLHFEGQLRWEGVRLARLALFAPDAPVKVAAGRSDGALEISLRLPPTAPDVAAGLQLRGDTRVTELELASRDGALALRWKELAVALAPLTLPLGEQPGAAPEIHVARLALTEPQLEYLLQAAPPNAATPAESAPTAEPAAPAESAEPEDAPPRIAVDALELTGGTLRFRDTIVRPHVDLSLRELRIRAQGVRWPERDVEKLLLTAKGQQAATLKLSGRVMGGAGGLDLELRQLPLSSFDPYAGAASGLQIENGRLSLSSKLSLGPQRMGAKSELALHQLSIREREDGWFQKAFGVPLDVALALLRDLDGDITLPVNMEQDAGGTRVGIAAAVTAALRQALVGALAAPLKLLGSVAGQAGSLLSSGLEPIPMEPGDSALSAAAHERIATLSKLLASRPGLKVSLTGRADASDDPLLARRAVLARARTDEPLAGEDELGFFERRRVRRALADADPEQPALEPEAAAALERLAGAVQIDEESRKALALARAHAVAQALQQEHGASADAVAAIETESGAPSVEIELRTQ